MHKGAPLSEQWVLYSSKLASSMEHYCWSNGLMALLLIVVKHETGSTSPSCPAFRHGHPRRFDIAFLSRFHSALMDTLKHRFPWLLIAPKCNDSPPYTSTRWTCQSINNSKLPEASRTAAGFLLLRLRTLHSCSATDFPAPPSTGRSKQCISPSWVMGL